MKQALIPTLLIALTLIAAASAVNETNSSMNDTNMTINVTINMTDTNVTMNETDVNVTMNETMNVTVNETADNSSVVMNETNDDANETMDQEANETGAPAFTLGYNQLPKAVAAGEISDGELANIIRNNNLNPGIINRLIKTEQLGNESLSAIAEMDFQPSGIFNKLFYGIGLKKTPVTQIANTYRLEGELAQKIQAHKDLSKGAAKKLQEEARARNEGKEAPGLAKKAPVAGDTAMNNAPMRPVAPGQEKKAADDDGQANPAGKVPPGQAKK